MNSNIIYDSIVIGAGPAGIGAAVQLRHNGLNILLMEKDIIGGSIRLAHKVENLITFTPISGVEVRKILIAMLKRKDISVIMEEAVRIEKFETNGFYKIYSRKGTYHCKTVVIATGLVRRIPDIRGVRKAIKDNLVFFDWQSLKKDVHSPVIIIGGGEISFDFACSLKKAGFELTIITRSLNPEINPYLLADVKRLSVSVIKGVRYRRIVVKDDFIDVLYEKDGRCEILNGRSILIACGGVPISNLAKTHSEEEGVFVCGDAKGSNFHQASIAFGDGVNTAMKVTKFLRE